MPGKITDFVSARSLTWLCTLVPVLILVNILYNVYLHPLRNVPGPFWARASGIPSWYYTARGKRHVWLWKLFQIYGKRIRVAPDLVLFCDPEAYSAIYGMESNVRRSTFYVGLTKSIREKNTLNTIDPAEHAQRRKILNTCLTETAITTLSSFMGRHVDRWHQLLLEGHSSTTEWSASMDLGLDLDRLVFDFMGEVCLGRSFNVKEPGDNPLKEVSESIEQYFKFYYPMCRSPFLGLIIWLKPRGLDRLVELITPPAVMQFQDFVTDSVEKGRELYQKQKDLPEHERRQDMLQFLCKVEDSNLTFTKDDLRAEATLLIMAGSDTTTISLSGIFWYLVRAPRCYQKLVDELQEAFETADDVFYGPKLISCTYLRACIDEGMRLVPPGPCEPPRQVLSGGITILEEFHPEGTVVGAAPWCDSLNAEVYGDPDVFRPERWVVNEAAGITKETISEYRPNFHPFLTGPGQCAGKSIALAELMLVVAKTLLRFDLRKSPGSTLGEGRPELGWGERNRNQYQFGDAFVTLKQGPEVQFRRRSVPDC